MYTVVLFTFQNGGDGIVNTFERILAESKETVKETDKRVWWTTRQRLDEEMQVSILFSSIYLFHKNDTS